MDGKKQEQEIWRTEEINLKFYDNREYLHMFLIIRFLDFWWESNVTKLPSFLLCTDPKTNELK